MGIQTIAEYLEGRGVEIEAKPNSKIEPDVYDMLEQAFQKDAAVKEKSEQISNRQREQREAVAITSTAKKAEEAEAEAAALAAAEAAEAAAAAAPVEAPAPVAEVEAPAVEPPAPAPAEVAEEAPVVAEAPAPEPKEEAPAAPEPEPTPAPEPVEEPQAEAAPEPEPEVKEEPKAEAPAEPAAPEEPKAEKAAPKAKAKDEPFRAPTSKTDGPKLMGTIDLDKVGKPTKKAAPKKKAEPAPKPVAEAPKAEVPKVEKPKAPVIELIKADAPKLAGLKVMGKIELPPDPRRKPKPVASSSDTSVGGKKKRPRKRIAKVDSAPSKGGAAKGRAKARPAKAPELTEKQIKNKINETLARLSGGKKNSAAGRRRDARKERQARSVEEIARMQEEATILQLTEFVTVSELGNMMSVPATDIIAACMSLGIFASINQRLDGETISIIAEEFGFQVEFVSSEVEESIPIEENNEERMASRPPIVTVMGHVDHGKTSLLDHIRKTKVIDGEAGGITQHIGAYSVTLDGGRKMTFLDTPGHEAFTAMRARGAQVTDLAIIVVAADDRVMPQTKEAISHAQAAEIPMIFAINKIDREESNPDRIKEELSQMNILVEEWGGKYQSQDISAKAGTNIDELLEKVLLEAELLELKADPEKRATGTVIESTLDKGRGYVTTLLVEGGTMNVGDSVLAGQWSGRVKAMFNERGAKAITAGPSTPVSMLGLSGAPNAGDKFYVLTDEKEARGIAMKRQQLQREQSVRAQQHLTLEEIGRRIEVGEFKELNLIVKGDVDGSVEALTDSLQKQSTAKVKVNVIHKAVGQISESDVLLGSASEAIIIGFQVRPSAAARKLAENEGIQIRLYSVIYNAIEEMKEAMEGLLSAKIEEKITATAEIREAFKISKVGTVAGCFVTEGTINRNSKVRIIRDGVVVYTGLLGSLKRFKDDVKEVSKGFECGLNIDRFNDIKVGDIIEAYEEVEVKQTLAD